MYISTDIEWELAEYEGLCDTFRVLSLTDESRNDLAQYLPQDRRFTSLHELRDELATILGLPGEDIIFEGI
ncbi:hypothetical protein DSLASN_31730 [Desulfoluna limicola]|uniref:Uncharacterized protein n=1 Tax=Desulfoluna limicola TaxID=2810562 RepID=A0ABM7PK20_9BACT|nr:hypothetical protein [Desulfoluna limicola]BCS97541.1 hypothetical protein DSLASN_31730 [Desulfoluna limicola]